MATTTTFNNGLYTPETATPTAAAVTVASTVASSTPATSLAAVTSASSSASVTPSSSAYEAPTTSSAAPVVVVSTTATSSISSASAAAPSSTRAVTKTTATQATTTASVAPATTTTRSTLSALTLTRATASAASGTALPVSNAATTPSFQTYYLAPLFVLFPIAAGAIVYFWWRRNKRRNRSKQSPAFDEYGSPVDERSLVQGKWGGEYGDHPGGGCSEKQRGGNMMDEGEERAAAPRGRWAGLLSLVKSRGPLEHYFPHYHSQSTATRNRNNNLVYKSPVFDTVPYATLAPRFHAAADQEQYQHAHLPSVEESEEHDDERGWSWGARAGISDRFRAGDAAAAEEQRGGGLTSGWRQATRKYRPKAGGSVRSQESLASLGAAHGRGGATDVLSPSIYSPENEYDDGRYDSASSDHQDLDAYLGESRVGNNGLAQRFMAGRMTANEAAITRQQPLAQYSDEEQPARERLARPAFRMDVEQLPSAPPLSHASPTKTTTTLVRPQPSPTTPSRRVHKNGTGEQDLLSSYNSPGQYSPTTAARNARPISMLENRIGGAMPAYQSGALPESASTYSFTGVSELVYGQPEQRSPVPARVLGPRAPTSTTPTRYSQPIRSDAPSPTKSASKPTHARGRSFDLAEAPTAGPLIFTVSPATKSASRVRQAIADVEARSPPTSPATPKRKAVPRTLMSEYEGAKEEKEQERISRLLFHRRTNSAGDAITTGTPLLPDSPATFTAPPLPTISNRAGVASGAGMSGEKKERRRKPKSVDLTGAAGGAAPNMVATKSYRRPMVSSPDEEAIRAPSSAAGKTITRGKSLSSERLNAMLRQPSSTGNLRAAGSQ